MIIDGLPGQDVLARTMWGEARGELGAELESVTQHDAGLAYWMIGEVALRRSRQSPSHGWPPSIEAVCLQPRQFSVWNPLDPNHEAMCRVKKESDRHFWWAWKIAHIVIVEGPAFLDADPDGLTGAANHYCTVGLYESDRRPRWADPARECARHLNHVFFQW